jgi:vacuole morphology and inheritance protein 14
MTTFYSGCFFVASLCTISMFPPRPSFFLLYYNFIHRLFYPPLSSSVLGEEIQSVQVFPVRESVPRITRELPASKQSSCICPLRLRIQLEMSDNGALGHQLYKQLIDTKQEARNKGAAELTAKIFSSFRELAPADAYAQALQALTASEAMLKNAMPSHRRGGLFSIKAIVGGLPVTKPHDRAFIKHAFELLVPNITDQDPTVRVAAVEAMHEMIRKFQTELLEVSFLDLFRSMLVCINDKDKRVSTATVELSRTAKEYVTGAEAEFFSIENFVLFVTEALDPAIATREGSGKELELVVVNWVLEWISHVYDLPGHNLVLQLGQYLSHLFYLQSRGDSPDTENILRRSLLDVKVAYNERKADVALQDLLRTTLDGITRIDHAGTRKMMLEWCSELLLLGGDDMLPLTHNIVDSILPQLSAKDPITRDVAKRVNSDLQRQFICFEQNKAVLAASSPAISAPSAPSEPGYLPKATIGYYGLLQHIISKFETKSKEETRIAALEWIALVHEVTRHVVKDHFETIFAAVLNNIADSSEAVMQKCIETLCIISGEEKFTHFVLNLLKAIEGKADILLPKAPAILKQVQLRYQGEHFSTCEKLFLKVAELLPGHSDKRFVNKLVIVLSTMLLSAKELLPLREVLKLGLLDERARGTFLGLYDCWAYDVLAALSLCLLTTAYDHAYRLVEYLGSTELSPQTLVQLDRLAQLIESPVFGFLRVALLRPSHNASLVKTLFGIQMILPQSTELYNTTKNLHRRLKVVPSVYVLEKDVPSEETAAQSRMAAEDRKQLVALLPLSKWEAMLATCRRAQRELLDYELKLKAARRSDK